MNAKNTVSKLLILGLAFSSSVALAQGPQRLGTFRAEQPSRPGLFGLTIAGHTDHTFLLDGTRLIVQSHSPNGLGPGRELNYTSDAEVVFMRKRGGSLKVVVKSNPAETRLPMDQVVAGQAIANEAFAPVESATGTQAHYTFRENGTLGVRFVTTTKALGEAVAKSETSGSLLAAPTAR